MLCSNPTFEELNGDIKYKRKVKVLQVYNIYEDNVIIEFIIPKDSKKNESEKPSNNLIQDTVFKTTVEDLDDNNDEPIDVEELLSSLDD